MATKKNLTVYIPLIIVILLVLVGAVYWYLDYTKYLRTDDAFVDSNIVTVSPKVMGRIVKIHVEEGDMVQQGQLIAELDSSDLYAQKVQAESLKIQSKNNESQSVAKYHYDKESQNVLKINLEKAKEDFARANVQFQGGVITQEQYDHAKKALETAQAQLDASQAQLLVSQAQIKNAESGVGVSQAQIDLISTQLGNYRLYAPSDGVIAKRWLLPGDVAQPGQSVFTINDTTNFWIVVYLEETKVGTIRNGREALFTIDTYSGVTFKGTVYDISSTTASQFSLIPPSNASGNFTKVTQRVPLKISIDGTTDNRNLSDFPLLTGMSAVVKIKK